MSQNFGSHKELAAEITKLVFKVSGWQWRIGDLIVQALEMPDENGLEMTQRRFREEYLPNVNKSYVSRWVTTARAFGEEDRAYAKAQGATWQDCLEARLSKDKCIKNNTAGDDECIRSFLDFQLAEKDKIKNSRSLSKERAIKKREEADAARQEEVDRVEAKAPEYLRKVIHGDTIEVMKAEAEAGDKFNLIWLDPPYGQYWKYDDGRCPPPPKGSPLLSECHHNNRKDGEDITLKAMRQSSQLLAEQGAVVLWQAGSEPDRVAVLQLAKEELGFEVIIPLYWDKGQAQPGNFACPFGYQTERILVMAKNFDAFYNNGDMPGRTDILDEKLAMRLYGEQRLECPSPVRQFNHELRKKDGEAKIGSMHFFQKPAWICRYFLERLTMRADRVLDAFGCSGVMCQEAISMQRDYLYVEQNRANYNLGLTNIRSTLIETGLIDEQPEEAVEFDGL